MWYCFKSLWTEPRFTLITTVSIETNPPLFSHLLLVPRDIHASPSGRLCGGLRPGQNIRLFARQCQATTTLTRVEKNCSFMIIQIQSTRRLSTQHLEEEAVTHRFQGPNDDVPRRDEDYPKYDGDLGVPFVQRKTAFKIVISCGLGISQVKNYGFETCPQERKMQQKKTTVIQK